MSSGKPTPEALCADFAAAIFGEADICAADVAHAIIADVSDSWALALRSAGVPEATIEAAAAVVSDYISNHYGEL